MVQFLKIDQSNKDQAIPPYLRKQQEAEQPKAKPTKARKTKRATKKAR